MGYHFPELCPEKGLAFRVIHVDNLPDVLRFGALAYNRSRPGQSYHAIGNDGIIDARKRRRVPIEPGGTLADYVPFYFTPRSMMLMNILTGRGVPQKPKQEMVILVSSVPHLVKMGARFIFTDGHAGMLESSFYDSPADLNQIDWDILQRSDFARSETDFGKSRRYQAELLVHGCVRVTDLLGLACSDAKAQQRFVSIVEAADLTLPVRVKHQWYPR